MTALEGTMLRSRKFYCPRGHRIDATDGNRVGKGLRRTRRDRVATQGAVLLDATDTEYMYGWTRCCTQYGDHPSCGKCQYSKFKLKRSTPRTQSKQQP